MIDDAQYLKRMEKLVKKATKQKFILKQKVNRLTKKIKLANEECEIVKEELNNLKSVTTKEVEYIPTLTPKVVQSEKDTSAIIVCGLLTVFTFFVTKMVCGMVIASKSNIEFIATNILSLQIMFIVVYYYLFCQK